MAVLTFDQIQRLSQRYALLEEQSVKSASLSDLATSVFLSYSSKDKPKLKGVIGFLKEHGASVYVDAGDIRLPQIPSPKTAEILRGRLITCKRFVVLVSQASYSSGWIPWELGLADGHKGIAAVALLPISLSQELPIWATREYLGLYKRIEFINKRWAVVAPGSSATWNLEDWISGEVR